jgi:hypothetical protein
MTAIPHPNLGKDPISSDFVSQPAVPVASGVVTGPAAAALASAGLGCSAMGVFTTLAEASPSLKKALNLYDPVGPLSGKVAGAIAVYIVSWFVLGLILRHREVHLVRWLTLTFILVGVGLVFTFPPVYDLFTAK